MRDRAGHDCNYLARSGILSAAWRTDSGPAPYNFQIADVAAGSNNAVVGILAAVYHRMRTGEGQYVDISMCDGVVPFNSMDGASFLAGGEPPEREGGLLNGGGIYDYYHRYHGGFGRPRMLPCLLPRPLYRRIHSRVRPANSGGGCLGCIECSGSEPVMSGMKICRRNRPGLFLNRYARLFW